MHRALPIPDQNDVLGLPPERLLKFRHGLDQVCKPKIALGPPRPCHNNGAHRTPSLGNRLRLTSLDVPRLKRRFQDERPGKTQGNQASLAFAEDQVRGPEGNLPAQIRNCCQEILSNRQQPLLSRQAPWHRKLRRRAKVVLEGAWDRVGPNPPSRDKRLQDLFQILCSPPSGGQVVIVHHESHLEGRDDSRARRQLGDHLHCICPVRLHIRDGVVSDRPREGLLLLSMVRQKGFQGESAELAHAPAEILRPLLD